MERASGAILRPGRRPDSSLLKSKLLPVPEFELKKLRRSVIYFAVLNYISRSRARMLIPSMIRIDQMAHLGGFLSGERIGVPLVPGVDGAPQGDLFGAMDCLRRRGRCRWRY